MPTDLDVYAPEPWVDDALFRPEVREAYRPLVAQGWIDALRQLHPGERISPRVAHLRAATAYCRFRAIAATSPVVTSQYDVNLLNRG